MNLESIPQCIAPCAIKIKPVNPSLMITRILATLFSLLIKRGYNLNKAIFFDRDDTLIHDTGYMYKLEDLKFFEDSIPVLKELQKRGYLLFIVTNQSGIGRGFYTIEDMHKFNNHMLSQLHDNGIEIQDLAFCPHSPQDNCLCRKPSPMLVNQLCDKYEIERNHSYMVGDKISDIECGKAAELKTFLINKNSHNIKDLISTLSV